MERFERAVYIAVIVAAINMLWSGSSSAADVAGTLDLALSVEQSATPTRDTCIAAGWARDPASTSPTRVDFYADAPYGLPGSKFVGAVIANQLRGDLPFPDKYHGFTYAFAPTVPSGAINPLLDGKPHALYAYGIALSGASSTAGLQLSGQTIRCPSNVKVGTDGIAGATGNGATEDGPAIQNAVSRAGSNAVIYFPAGDYVIGRNQGGNTGCYVSTDCPSSYMPYTSDHRFVGNGILVGKPQSGAAVPVSDIKLTGELAGTTRLARLKIGNDANAPATRKVRLLTVDSNASRVTIRDLIFDGNAAARNAATGWPTGDVVDGLVVGWLAKQLTIDSVEIRDGIEDGTGCWMCVDYKVLGSYIHNNGKYMGATEIAGAAGISVSATYRAIVSGNVLVNNGSGVWVAFGSGDAQVLGNTITAHRKGGVDVGGTGDNPAYVRIRNNFIYDNGAFGFAAVGIYNGGTNASASLAAIPGGGVTTGQFLGLNEITGNTVAGNYKAPPNDVPGIWLFGNPSSVTAPTGEVTPGGATSHWTINGCNKIMGRYASLPNRQKWGVQIRTGANNIVVAGNQITENGPEGDYLNPFWQVWVELVAGQTDEARRNADRLTIYNNSVSCP